MRLQFSKLVVMTAAAAGVAGLGHGCGGEAAQRPAVEADAGEHDAQVDAPYTMSGPYRCCAPGTGTACCTDTKEGMCFEYGGIYGDCRKAGEQYEGKVICAQCCPGLTRGAILVHGDRVPPSADQLPEGCDDEAPPSLGVCIQCGDGLCGPGENFCNCPDDCPRPADAG